MSRGSWALLISIALAPMTASPLGLGDIHVDSDLNERLKARIDIVGATPDELQALSAVIANRDAFLRAGVERPAFLSSIAFKVATDSDGRAVLSVTSSDAFTDPLVGLLVDLRWPHGELIREYTLLLDPADPGFRNRLAAASHRAAPIDADEAASQLGAMHSAHTRLSRTVRNVATEAEQSRRVLANTSLRRLARRAGARGRTDMHRMMLAIYRANPNAFDGSILRLHRGASVVLPTREAAAQLSRALAEREYQTLLHATDPALVAATATTPTSMPARQSEAALTEAANSDMPAALATSAASAAAPATAMDNRVRSLERSIDELKTMLASEHSKFAWLQEQAAARPVPDAATAVAWTSSVTTPIAAVLSFVLGLFAALRWRHRRPTAAADAAVPAPVTLAPPPSMFRDVVVEPAVSVASITPARAPAPVPVPVPVPITVSVRAPPNDGISVVESVQLDDITALLPDEPTLVASAMDTIDIPVPTGIREATFVYGGETTAVLAVEPDELFDETLVGMENVKLDYNLTDLDTTAQHVQLPSALNDAVEAEEHRTNIIDVLKVAIDRDPHRLDLQMKLIEVYFAQRNREAFMNLFEKLVLHRDQLTSIDWQKVLMMGRQIAPDDALFKIDAESSFAA